MHIPVCEHCNSKKVLFNLLQIQIGVKSLWKSRRNCNKCKEKENKHEKKKIVQINLSMRLRRNTKGM